MRDSCERSDPNGMGRPSCALQGSATPAMLHAGKHSLHSLRNTSAIWPMNKIVAIRKKCIVLINYRLPLSSNSRRGSDLATGLFALVIMKALWSTMASANASPRVEGLGEILTLFPRRSSIAQLLMQERHEMIDSRFLTNSWQQGRCVALNVHGKGVSRLLVPC